MSRSYLDILQSILAGSGDPQLNPEAAAMYPRLEEPKQPSSGVAPDAGRPAPRMPATMDAAPAMPTDPNSRMDSWRNLLTDFVWSLSEGLTARGKNRRSGTGEALMGPWSRQAYEDKRKLEEQKARTSEIQGMQTLALLQPRIAETLSRAGTNQARVPELLTQADLNEARAKAVTDPTLQRPGIERMSGQVISVNDAKLLASQGQKFLDREGREINVDVLPAHMALAVISGGTPGQPRFQIVTDPTRTVTQDNVTSVVPTHTPEVPRTQGTAQTPTVSRGYSTTQNINPDTGEVVLQQLPTGSVSQRQTTGPAPVVDRYGQPTNPNQVQQSPSPQGAGGGVGPQGQPQSQVTPSPGPGPATNTPLTPPPPSTSAGAGLPPGELGRQRQFAVPIKAAAVQIFGDPKRPDFQPLSAFAHLADDPDSRRRVGTAARVIINQMVEAESKGAHVGTLLGEGGLAGLFGVSELLDMVKNDAGIPVALAESQAHAVSTSLARLTDEERAMLNRIMAAYGTVVGLRSLTRGSAYRFSTLSMERELPIPGISDVLNSTTYYSKLASLAEEIATGIDGSGISKRIMPEQDYYKQQATELAAKARGRNPNTSTPDQGRPQFIYRGGKLTPVQ